MGTSNVARRVKMGAASVLGAALLLTGVVGFAHTKPGRPLLALMGMHGPRSAKGGCPLGLDRAASPAQREAARSAFAATHRGDTPAAARPALGFALDVTTRADVTAWSAAHGVSCQKPHSGADLDCADVPDALLPDALRGVGIRNLWLTFGEADTLVSVVAVRRDAHAAAIADTFRAVARDLDHEAGPPASVVGEATATRLASGLLQQATVEYRFRDYYAVARATNMGDAFVLTEEYRSLPN